MAGGAKRDAHAIDVEGFPVGQGLLGFARAIAHAGAHDRQRLRGGQDRGVAGASVVGMAVGDDGAGHGTGGVDVEIAGRAVEAGIGDAEPMFRIVQQ